MDELSMCVRRKFLTSECRKEREYVAKVRKKTGRLKDFGYSKGQRRMSPMWKPV